MSRILTRPFQKALIVESPHPTLDAHLAKWGIDAVRVDRVPDDAALIEALQETGADVLFKRSRVPVTRHVLESCPNLHAVQLCCIGDDSVDKQAAADHGVMVFNDPQSNARSVVELTVGHLIALSRRLYETNVGIHAHQWDKNNKGRFEILGKRLGIFGLGNIGRQVAKVAEALGMEVVFFDNRPVAQEVGTEMGWENAETLEHLFKSADMVTCHTSARDAWGRDNAGLLNAYLPMLGEDRGERSPRIFVNLARGNLYSSEALLGAVQSGAIRKAAVDVYEEEPAPGNPWTNPYAGETNIVGTPHIGAATQEAQPRIAQRVARTMGRYSRFGSLRDCVYLPRFSMLLPPARPGQAILAVVHSTARGTKKVVQDAIYEAQASTLGSSHQDFSNGVAYDLSILDRPLPLEELERISAYAKELLNDPLAIRSIRQVVVPEAGW